MAMEQTFQALGSLNQYLAQETAYARQEEEKARLNRGLDLVSKKFLELPIDASEGEIQNTMYKAVSDATKMGVGARLFPTINALYKDEVSAYDKNKREQEGRDFVKAIGTASGKPVEALSAEYAATFLELTKAKEYQHNYIGPEGRSKLVVTGFGPFDEERTEKLYEMEFKTSDDTFAAKTIREMKVAEKRASFNAVNRAQKVGKISEEGYPLSWYQGEYFEHRPEGIMPYTGTTYNTEGKSTQGKFAISTSKFYYERADAPATELYNFIKGNSQLSKSDKMDIETISTGDPKGSIARAVKNMVDLGAVDKLVREVNARDDLDPVLKAKKITRIFELVDQFEGSLQKSDEAIQRLENKTGTTYSSERARDNASLINNWHLMSQSQRQDPKNIALYQQALRETNGQ